MGFSSAVLNDVAGNVNTDPMDLEGQMAGGGDLGGFVMAVLQAGGVFDFTIGGQSFSESIANGLVMNEGNGSGGGASDDAGGDKGNGDSKSSSSDGSNSKGSSTGEKAMDQTGNVGYGLSLIGYSMEKSTSLGFSKWGKFLGHTGDALGFAGLAYDAYQYKKGNVSGEKFGYDAFGFGASIFASYRFGAAAGLETGGLFIYLDVVHKEGQMLWNSFKTSYNDWYNSRVSIIEQGGNPFYRPVF